jgi:ribosomal protein S18 acetylase RimI-like enzyme
MDLELSMRTEIRDASEEDLEKINEISIESELYHSKMLPEIFASPDGFQFNLDYLNKVLRTKEGRIFVATAGKRIVGYAIVYPGKDRSWPTFRKRKFLYIDTLDVRKGFTHKGIGTALLNHCEGFAKSHRYAYLELNVLTVNKDALALYRSRGFNTYIERMMKKL